MELPIDPTRLCQDCGRRFLPGAKGRPWSKLPLAEGWERVISGNSCPKGLVEDTNELRVVKAKLEEVKREYPNVAEVVRKDAFRRPRAGEPPHCTSASCGAIRSVPAGAPRAPASCPPIQRSSSAGGPS